VEHLETEWKCFVLVHVNLSSLSWLLISGASYRTSVRGFNASPILLIAF
jgi:hypothetical protein